MDPIQAADGEVTPENATTGALDEQVPAVAPQQAGGPIMSDLPVQDWDYQQPRRGQLRPGIILSIGEQEIIVGLDAKRDGVVRAEDIQRMGPEALGKLSVGDKVDVFVLQPEDQDGNLVVSLFLAAQARAWEHAKQLADSGEIWEAEVIGYNKGGLVVPVGDLRGFIPASQVPGFPQSLDQEDRIRRLADTVGQTLRVKVIEIDRRNRRLILSALAADREWRQAERERLMADLREGEVRRGQVSSLAPFGAFIDLGGAEGLVHLSELSWQRVRHPKEILKVGDEVEVFVLRLDYENSRIGLSMKRLEPEPWALVEDKYELGQLVEGVITNVVDFGAFAQIEEGVEGLIHVSELTDQPLSHPRDIVRRGDYLLLRIIRIDLRRKRLGLSLKRVLESEWADWAAQQPEETRHRGAARRTRRTTKPTPRVPEPVAEPTPELPEPAAEPEELAQPVPGSEAIGQPTPVVETPAPLEPAAEPEELTQPVPGSEAIPQPTPAVETPAPAEPAAKPEELTQPVPGSEAIAQPTPVEDTPAPAEPAAETTPVALG